ncbi:MAG: hypothetical protein ACRC43_08220, partial [Plesiomonas shigelloides]
AADYSLSEGARRKEKITDLRPARQPTARRTSTLKRASGVNLSRVQTPDAALGQTHTDKEQLMWRRFPLLSAKKQCLFFHFAFLLNMLALILTDAGLPLLIGCLITGYLALESWIRWRYVQPLREENRRLRHQLSQLQQNRAESSDSWPEA